MEIEKDIRTAELLSLYGGLLTERQQKMMSLYYNDDLSLAEIAEQMKITRQGVFDSIKHGAKTLVTLEDNLGFYAFSEQRKKELYEIKAQALEVLEECRKISFAKNVADKTIVLLENLDSKLEEFENDETE
ncbi:MAG: putative DNA-binding protein [Ruminococcus sp.]|nr:putative DNA-binding protein [Ruminococcus sp.]